MSGSSEMRDKKVTDYEMPVAPSGYKNHMIVNVGCCEDLPIHSPFFAFSGCDNE